MKKICENLKVFIIVLLIVLIAIIAFLGVFVKENGVWKNIIPDYKYGMDIKGFRELRYTLNDSEEDKYVYVDENGNVVGEVLKDGNAVTAEDEETSEEGQTDEISYSKETRNIKVNEDSSLTKENFEVAKRIIQRRLKKQDIEDYNIRLDDITGKLVIETANDDEKIGLVQDLIGVQGKFKIIDYQNGVILMDNSDIKNVTVVSSNNQVYRTYLQIVFNKQGAEKLRQISTKYVEEKNENQSEENTEEQSTSEEETSKKYVSVIFDDKTMMTTYFGEEMPGGILQISIGQARTDRADFMKDYKSAKIIADILNSGVLPIKYELETDNFVMSEITDSKLNTIKIIGAVLVLIISILFIVMHKKKGVLASVLAVGYIAILSIIAKYTNVLITVNSLIAYILVIIANYVFLYMLMKESKEKEFIVSYDNVMKKFWLNSIPVIVLTVVFTFTKYSMINSIGMMLFWGIILNALYNLLFTKAIFKK